MTIVSRTPPKQVVANSEFVYADFSTVSGCKELVNKLKNERFDTIVACVGFIARNKLVRTADGVE